MKTVEKLEKELHVFTKYNTCKSVFMGKSDEEIADEVITGKWGNGYDRIYRLGAAGYDHDIIQNIINCKLAQAQRDAIKKIIFNQKACIVFWKDDTKTVVKRKENDKFDKYAAVAQAIAKHQYRSTSAFHKMVDSVSVSNVMTKIKRLIGAIYDYIIFIIFNNYFNYFYNICNRVFIIGWNTYDHSGYHRYLYRFNYTFNKKRNKLWILL